MLPKVQIAALYANPALHGVDVKIVANVQPLQPTQPNAPEHGRTWLMIQDKSGRAYAYGPPIKGNFFLEGAFQSNGNSAYFLVSKAQKIGKGLPIPIVIFLTLLVVVGLAVAGVYLAAPELLLGVLPEPIDYMNATDVQKDASVEFSQLLIWNEGTKLCTILKNSGQMSVPKADLEKITAKVNNRTVQWEKAEIPHVLKRGEKLTICICDMVGGGCTDPDAVFVFTKQAAALQVQPRFGTIVQGS